MTEIACITDYTTDRVLHQLRWPNYHWFPLVRAHYQSYLNQRVNFTYLSSFMTPDNAEVKELADLIQPLHLVQWAEGDRLRLEANEAYWALLTLPMFTHLYLEWVSKDPKMVHLKHVCQFAEHSWGKDWISWKNPEQHAGVSRFDRNFEL